jgi:hypothetical protein
VVQGCARAADHAHRGRAWLAWHTARLGQVNPKKFPKLEDLTGRRKRRPKKNQPRPWQELMATAQAWAAATAIHEP